MRLYKRGQHISYLTVFSKFLFEKYVTSLIGSRDLCVTVQKDVQMVGKGAS